MSSKCIDIHSTRPVSPMIYAYSLPGVTYKEGWIKIGYTEQSVEERINQQTRTAGLHWKEEWRGHALYEDGSGSFRDTDFHSFLRSKGIKQKKGEQGEEWFEISGEESQKLFFEFKTKGFKEEQAGPIPYTLRKEQAEAVTQAKTYFDNHNHSEFLWNAKPRFGKTLSTYELCKEMSADRVLIVTNRPAIANSWFEDYTKFLGRESGYVFVSETQSLKNKSSALTWDEYEFKKKNDPTIKCILFLSLQDLKGSLYFGGEYDKLRYVQSTAWDLLVIDEAHEGVDTTKTDIAFDKIERDWTLHLSGTPFKALANSKFPEDAIYNWTYVDEQVAKKDWVDIPGTINPYGSLPKLEMYTYQMSEIALDEAEKGIDLDGNQEAYAFDLNEFFATKSDRFEHELAVNRFLNALATQTKFPFSTPELRKELKHTLWILNRVDSAKALARKLEDHPVFGKYKIILAAGDGRLDENEEKIKAFDKVTKAIREYEYTITLSVGQLTVGVTIPEWTAVLMLSSISSPAQYIQAAFRAQNPHTFNDNGRFYRKETAYVFDFDPARTLDIFEKFANDLLSDTSNGKGEEGLRKDHVGKLLNFFPIYGEDDSGQMVELDTEKVLSIPRKIRSKEVVRHGFMSNYLFQNITNVFNAPDSVLSLIGKIAPVEDKGPITSDVGEISLDNEGNVKIEKERVIGLSANIFGDKIYEVEPETLIDILQDAEQSAPPSLIEDQCNQIVRKINIGITNPMLDRAKEYFGSDLSSSAQKKLAKKVSSNAENEVKRIFGDYKITKNTLSADCNRELDRTTSESEKMEILDRYERKKSEALDNLKKDITDTVENLAESTGNIIVEKVLQDRDEKKKNAVNEEIRNHLRGFSRTIPSFLMAYGGKYEITLANFDSIIPDDVFEEVTSISKKEFRLLRDGGTIHNGETGIEEEFRGHLFDEVVFNDSVKEFLALKRKLANYFDESAKEDIFDYIPPQQTNQIFTPKKIVKEMVDMLERENPGCFDDDTKTFADLYMKSGLYITEIVKRLYRSERMKILYPNDEDRLKHIFAKQVYGIAPSEIIYRIAMSFILGFSDIIKIDEHNIRLCDSLKYAKSGNLEEKLEKVFDEPAPSLEDTVPTSTVVMFEPSKNDKRVSQKYSVTHKIKSLKQPRGGYINPKMMTEVPFDDGKTLKEESIHPSTVGMVVDYLTRFDNGETAESAFSISLMGASLVDRNREVSGYIGKISGLDNESIENACKAVYYDQFYRTGCKLNGDPVYNIPDSQTCDNIRIMVARVKTFLKTYGPIVREAPVFPGGDSPTVATSDGDFITKDTIWDLKVSNAPPKNTHTLQLAMYYLMAKRSDVPEYRSLTKVGIFNPRLNTAYILDMGDVPDEVLKRIGREVLEYPEP